MDCVFCKIIDGEIPSKIIYEDEDVIAFDDVDPQAPIHFLVIPKKHIKSLDELSESDSSLIGKIFLTIKKIAREKGIAENGYRVVHNIGEDGGQSVAHMHFHVLGGRSLQWPPGWFEILSADTRGGIEMTEIRVGENESIDSAIKRFKRQCARSGVLSEYRRREHYEKPSVIRKKKNDAAKRKNRKNR